MQVLKKHTPSKKIFFELETSIFSFFGYHIKRFFNPKYCYSLQNFILKGERGIHPRVNYGLHFSQTRGLSEKTTIMAKNSKVMRA